MHVGEILTKKKPADIPRVAFTYEKWGYDGI